MLILVPPWIDVTLVKFYCNEKWLTRGSDITAPSSPTFWMILITVRGPSSKEM